MVLSRTGIDHPRCHLDSRFDPCTHRDTNISPATNVCHTSHDTRLISRSLRPQRPIWQSAFDPAPSPPDSLCVHNYFDFRFYGFYEIFLIIVPARPFVNPKFLGCQGEAIHNVSKTLPRAVSGLPWCGFLQECSIRIKTRQERVFPVSIVLYDHALVKAVSA